MSEKCVRPPHGSYGEWIAFAEKQRAKGRTQKQCALCGLWLFPCERKTHKVKK